MKLADCHSIADLRDAAKARAHRMVFEYIDGGADDELTLRANSSDFADWTFRHRVLRDVSEIDTSVTLLGKPHPLPFFLSPTAGNRLFHKDGERAVAAAAGKAGIVCGLSTLGSVSIEDHINCGNGPKWFQTYVWKDRGLTREMLARAKAAGYEALALTVDLPVHGNRERDHRTGFSIPPKLGPRQVWDAVKRPRWTSEYLTSPAIRYANLSQTTDAMSLADFIAEQLDPSFTWHDAELLLAEWNGPAILKGVVHPDDARQAQRLGFAAVSVSNHGGRQLDRDISAIEALPDIVSAVGESIDVTIDSGIRRGTDILIALALGAKAVGVGRAYLYGLAAAGEPGVTHAIKILVDEVRRDLALLGFSKITGLSRKGLYPSA
ncbi:MAG: alpha-hydroxy acid oxidase [Pacificimonas sp.]